MIPDISMDLILRAKEVVSGHVRRTPLFFSEWLSKETGAEVYLKCENLQRTGSFKVRGGFAHLGLYPESKKGVVAASAGNHGQGLAIASKTFDVPCTIVVPKGVPKVKEEAMRSFGARVILSPFDGYDDTELWTREQIDELGGTWVSAFDDPGVIAGNGGTTGLEIFEEIPDIDTIVVSCGGGGCSIGLGVVAHQQNARVIGVNSDSSPGMWLSRKEGKAHLKIDSKPTIAEGLEGGVSEVSYRLGLEYIDDVVLAKEADLRKTVPAIARKEKMVVEGSAAAGVAALLDGQISGKKIVVVLTGSNIDPARFSTLLQES